MAYTPVPTIIDGDTITEDWTLAVEAAIEEMQVAVPDTVGTYTPTLTGSVTNPNLGSTGSAQGRYIRSGRLVVIQFHFTFNGTGISQGSGTVQIGLPDIGETGFSSSVPVGTAITRDMSAAQSVDSTLHFTAGALVPYNINTSLAALGARTWATIGVTFAATDIIAGQAMMYIP